MISFVELKKKSQKFYPAILLDQFIGEHNRKIVRLLLWTALWISVALVLVSTFNTILYLFPDSIEYFLENNRFKIRGATFLIIASIIYAYLIEFFYNSHYFNHDTQIGYDLAQILNDTDRADLTAGFLNSNFGKITMFRCGINPKEIADFLKKRLTKINDLVFKIPLIFMESQEILTNEYSGALYDCDAELRDFLETKGVNRETFSGATKWTSHSHWRNSHEKQWWTRDSLMRVPALGRNWSFGKVYLLEKFGRSIYADPLYSEIELKLKIYEPSVLKIENIFLKKSGANVLLVVPTIEIGQNVVSTLGKMIALGTINPELDDKRVFVIDGRAIFQEKTDKATFERELTDVLLQANNAGNVIIAIPYFADFIESAYQIGSNVTEIFDEFLRNTRTHLIGIVERNKYHSTIETNRNLTQHFEKLNIDDVNLGEALIFLMSEADRIEQEENVYFLYTALKTIATGAEQYFSDNIYSDKILDLIQEVVNKAKIEKKKIITPNDVLSVITLQTGIPLGDITEGEKIELGHLEEVLHKRVIGQELAIELISKAMRRARVGIQNPKRPIASFIFLGPTGVGKTETAKALAEAFFNDENQMIRFDMSEYSGTDGLMRLIGVGENKIGALAKSVREHPYGVLLLDEFEKADTGVRDLFLQILDEGHFSDSRGELINTRNLIIIATSNAGSDLIFENIDSLGDAVNQEITKKIIERGDFKPELLNRFDGVIMFHPLNTNHLREVAKLMLLRLNKRILKNSLKIDFNEDLLNYLVKVGNNPQFGAREMNRAIQDEIESEIASAMIDGRIKNGDLIKFKLAGDKLTI